MLRYNAGRAVRPSSYVCPRCIQRATTAATLKRVVHETTRKPKRHDSLLTLLEDRGYVNQIAGDRSILDGLLKSKRVGIYAGVDPTAPSLHLGNLLPIMVLFWASLYGHHAISLVGAATARVGDPSGRLTSRAKTAETTQINNAVQMFNQTHTLWKNAMRYAQRHGYQDTEIEKFRLLENAKWLDQLNILDFLKVLGNGMRLGTMLGRDTVRNKMEKGDGMSFAEFTYPLLQAWDWWHMYSTMNVQLQIGGSDQYGNIVSGMDAVKYIAQTHHIAGDQPQWLDSEGRLRDELAPMGLTVPLLTTASGEKFGKSAGNAIWLDSKMTSPFDLYGFLLRSSDADVSRYLKLFTFVTMEDINTLMTEHNADRGRRKAQHLLASEVLELVHGRDVALKTRAEHEMSRSPNVGFLSSSNASASADEELKESADTNRIYLPHSLVYNTPMARILYHAGLAPSKSEGARLVAKGGVYVASSRRDGEDLSWTQLRGVKAENVEALLVDGLLMLRIGKWKVRVLEAIDDDTFAFKGLDAVGWDEWRKKSIDE